MALLISAQPAALLFADIQPPMIVSITSYLRLLNISDFYSIYLGHFFQSPHRPRRRRSSQKLPRERSIAFARQRALRQPWRHDHFTAREPPTKGVRHQPRSRRS
jgi:hypothetical protein